MTEIESETMFLDSLNIVKMSILQLNLSKPKSQQGFWKTKLIINKYIISEEKTQGEVTYRGIIKL